MAAMMQSEKGAVARIVQETWPGLHVLVVGDVMLDKYIWGEVERISPEAPIPVVRVSHQTEQPGGAANVAMNIVALGAQVTVAGFVGRDPDGERLQARLQAEGVTTQLMILKDRPTSTKTRILGGRQQMLRVDLESAGPALEESYQALLHTIVSMLEPPKTARKTPVSVIVLSDYAKGVLGSELCRGIISKARLLHIPVVVDPKGRGYSRYEGATTLCPNLAELASETNTVGSDEEVILCAGEVLLAGLGCESLTVTLSERGIVVLNGRTRQRAGAVARQVFDVSGAGDTVTAVMALCRVSGIATREALELANLAAGVVVAKVGTAPARQDELLAALDVPAAATFRRSAARVEAAAPIPASLESMVSRVAAWRNAGDTIVFTNGCFDLLHAGHVSLLEAARAMGDRLVVGVNSDASVRRLKGPGRPVMTGNDRAIVLGALSAVDGVVLFEEETPLLCILALRPDILVKGSDYAAKNVVGSVEVQSWGGNVMLVPLCGQASTTAIIANVITSVAGPRSFEPATGCSVS